VQEQSPPVEFRAALARIHSIHSRAEIEIAEAPAPQRLAPFAAAITADVVVDDLETANGRLVLLFDPNGQDAWEGNWRVVVFAKATLEPEMSGDHMLSDVGWAWLEEALVQQGVALTTFGGTVTRTHSVAYGAMSHREPHGDLELRASWTPLDNHADLHAKAWLAALADMAGLSPVAEGVTQLR
jgi:hypothetical protein